MLAREAHFPATIADLYDPETMPDNPRMAHERNDEVIERIYIGRRFKNDTERLEKLFEMYTKMTADTGVKKKGKKHDRTYRQSTEHLHSSFWSPSRRLTLVPAIKLMSWRAPCRANLCQAR